MFQWTTFLIYTVSMSFSPGPNNLLCMTLGSKQSYIKTLPYILGVAMGWFTLYMVGYTLNQTVAMVLPTVQIIIHYLGAAYLIYLAISLLGVFKHKHVKPLQEISTFKQGVLLQFLNPKGLMASVTIVTVFIAPCNPNYFFVCVIGAILMFFAFAANTTWTLLGTTLQKCTQKYGKLINGAMAILLIYTAISTF